MVYVTYSDVLLYSVLRSMIIHLVLPSAGGVILVKNDHVKFKKIIRLHPLHYCRWLINSVTQRQIHQAVAATARNEIETDMRTERDPPKDITVLTNTLLLGVAGPLSFLVIELPLGHLTIIRCRSRAAARQCTFPPIVTRDTTLLANRPQRVLVTLNSRRQEE